MIGRFSDNAQHSRFEYEVDGRVAFANYRREGSTIFIDHVEAPHELRGTGAAGTLMQHIMTYTKQENMKVIPFCGYAKSWISKNSGSAPKI